MKSKLVKMTPQMAEELLKQNTNNRGLSEKLVTSYANDMTAGRWRLNGDAIRISEAGILLDGQHRLAAVVKSGETIETMLVEGLPDEVMDTIDAGRKRAVHDVLQIKGIGDGHGRHLGAAARQVVAYLQGTNRKASMTNATVIEFIEQHMDLVGWVNEAYPSRPIVHVSALAAVCYLATRATNIDLEDAAKSFIQGIAYGSELPPGDARLAGRNSLLGYRSRAKGLGVATNETSFVLLAHAWNAFITGQKRDFIRMQPDAKGAITPPDIIGAPMRGEGLDALAGVELDKRTLERVTSAMKAVAAEPVAAE